MGNKDIHARSVATCLILASIVLETPGASPRDKAKIVLRSMAFGLRGSEASEIFIRCCARARFGLHTVELIGEQPVKAARIADLLGDMDTDEQLSAFAGITSAEADRNPDWAEAKELVRLLDEAVEAAARAHCGHLHA